MKFGKHLKEHRVAEWQEKYIDYSALKKLITGVGKSRSASLMELQPANVGSPPSPTCAISPPTLSEQLHTFPIINSPSSSSLNRSGRGMRFGRKTQQPRTSAQPPSSPPTTFGEFLNSSASSSEKMFFVYLDAQVEQADSFLVGNCDQAQVRFRALKDQSIVYLARKRDHEGQRNRGKNLQYEFAAAIESDLKKIKNKIGGTLRHMIPASKQPSGVSSEIEMKPMESTATTAATATAKGKSTAIADSEDSLGSQPILAADQEVGLSTEILVQTSKHLRDAKLVIKSAMLEFYRYLELLKNYKV